MTTGVLESSEGEEMSPLATECQRFWCQSFGVFILFLDRFRLLSGHLLGNSCSIGGPYVLFVF